jgi:aspartate carbamoyltransferase catalytic subunit
MHSRVALSNIFCLKKLGANIKLCGPPTLIPKYVEELGVTVSHSIEETLAWCNVANVLRIQMERADDAYFPSTSEYAAFYGLNMERLNKLSETITILHPGPINRGVEITTDVADSTLCHTRSGRKWSGCAHGGHLSAIFSAHAAEKLSYYPFLRSTKFCPK